MAVKLRAVLVIVLVRGMLLKPRPLPENNSVLIIDAPPLKRNSGVNHR